MHRRVSQWRAHMHYIKKILEPRSNKQGMGNQTYIRMSRETGQKKSSVPIRCLQGWIYSLLDQPFNHFEASTRGREYQTVISTTIVRFQSYLWVLKAQEIF
jgi:predicted DNA binding CopG/RHH family protein